jgi:hypothetical protein
MVPLTNAAMSGVVRAPLPQMRALHGSVTLGATRRATRTGGAM